MQKQTSSQLSEPLRRKLRTKYKGEITALFKWKITDPWQKIQKEQSEQLRNSDKYINDYTLPYSYAAQWDVLDFYISGLQLDADLVAWHILANLIQSCGCCFTFTEVCIVSDRPPHIRLDEQGCLHALGQPAIEFADGCKLYYYHNLKFPQKYGQYLPQEWKIEWFLAEHNIQICRILAREMRIVIKSLTPAQIDLIQAYQEKWRPLFFQTDSIDRNKVNDAINCLYKFIGSTSPKIIFYPNPYDALKAAADMENFSNANTCRKIYNLVMRIKNNLAYQLEIINTKWRLPLRDNLLRALAAQIDSSINFRMWEIGENLNARRFQGWNVDSSYLDFCISVLNCHCDRAAWEVYRNVIENCGWFLTFEDICLVCERPQQLRVNENFQLHAEGEPAIVYADGFKAYAYCGIALPEKYGSIHPQQWQAEWLLEEENAELRRALIQGIGYARICQELNAEALDVWREYELLKIENDIDEEPIYLLKMTCPSTGFIHALRVPPEIDSARDAIRWVNWDIDPEEFAIET